MKQMPDPRINRFYREASGRCINCEKKIRSQVYLEWEEERVFLCSDCLMNLYDSIFTIKPTESARKKYKKTKIPPKFRWEIWERDNFTCQYCGSRKSLTVDHIVPESKGGVLENRNAVTACENCNSQKGSRTPEEAGMKLINDPRG